MAGTPLAPWFFRALGVRIGRRVYLETTEFTEYDLVSVGDDEGATSNHLGPSESSTAHAEQAATPVPPSGAELVSLFCG